jgi:transcriptional regulator with XRE-family HTH domain
MTPRMFLAKEIQRAREEIGAKPDDVAKSIFVSEGLVRSWERGRRIPQPDHLEKVEELVGPEAIKGILGRLREELINAAVPLEWMGKWLEIEAQSTSLLSFQTTVVPGLLQTPDYANAVFKMASHLGDTAQNVEKRLKRQEILTREDDPPTFVVVVSETVLVSGVGGPDVMRAQLAHLIDMAELDNVFIHVVPFASGVCAGFVAPFVVASFDGGEVAYVDDQLKAEVVEEPENVAVLRRMFERFRADALRQPDSIAMIKRTMEERWITK